MIGIRQKAAQHRSQGADRIRRESRLRAQRQPAAQGKAEMVASRHKAEDTPWETETCAALGAAPFLPNPAGIQTRRDMTTTITPAGTGHVLQAKGPGAPPLQLVYESFANAAEASARWEQGAFLSRLPQGRRRAVVTLGSALEEAIVLASDQAGAPTSLSACLAGLREDPALAFPLVTAGAVEFNGILDRRATLVGLDQALWEMAFLLAARERFLEGVPGWRDYAGIIGVEHSGALPLSNEEILLARTAAERSFHVSVRWMTELALRFGADEKTILGLTWDRIDLPLGHATLGDGRMVSLPLEMRNILEHKGDTNQGLPFQAMNLGNPLRFLRSMSQKIGRSDLTLGALRAGGWRRRMLGGTHPLALLPETGMSSKGPSQ